MKGLTGQAEMFPVIDEMLEEDPSLQPLAEALFHVSTEAGFIAGNLLMVKDDEDDAKALLAFLREQGENATYRNVYYAAANLSQAHHLNEPGYFVNEHDE